MMLTTYHPTFALKYDVSYRAIFRADLARFARMVHGKTPDPIRILEDWTEMYEQILKEGIFAFDLETYSPDPGRPELAKDPTRAVVRLLGVGTMVHGFSTSPGPFDSEILSLLADPSLTKVFQNGWWYDDRVMRARFGERYELNGPVFDTRDMRRALSASSDLDLGFMVSLYDDCGAWKSHDKKKGSDYNAEDCIRTRRLHRGMLAEPDWSTDRVQGLYTLHTELARVYAEMHSTGICVDENRRKWLSSHLRGCQEGRTRSFLELCGIPEMRAVPGDLRALLYKKHETEKIRRFSLENPIKRVFGKKKTDAISVDQKTLLFLISRPDCPQEVKQVVDAWWKVQGVAKALSTFVDSKLVENAIGHDGRLRPGWNSCGTDTGRPSCNEPNILNIAKAKDEDDGALVGDLPDLRSMYVAPPGEVMIEADYAQQELWVMALLSDDPVLLKALGGGDVYTQDGIAIFGLPPTTTRQELGKERRQTAKVGHLGFQYAAGLMTLYQQFLESDRTMTIPQCELVLNGLRRRYKRTVAWWSEEKRRVEACGYSESAIMQRRLIYPKMPMLTKLANQPVQSTASDITNLALVNTWKTLKAHVPSARIIIAQYDAIYVTSPERHAGEAERILVDCMQAPVTIRGKSHSFKVDVSRKDRWGKL